MAVEYGRVNIGLVKEVVKENEWRRSQLMMITGGSLSRFKSDMIAEKASRMEVSRGLSLLFVEGRRLDEYEHW